MKKVLHIIDHPGLGGAQRIVGDIVRNQDHVFIFPVRHKNRNVTQICAPEHKYILQPSETFWEFILNMLRLPGVIRNENIQIVHCHLFLSWLCGLWLSLWWRKDDRPTLVFHEHDSVRLDKWYYPMLIYLVKRAGWVVAVSDYLKNAIASIDHKPDDVFVLKNSVDLNHFAPGSMKEENHPDLPEARESGSAVIGYASRLVDYKGWQFVVDLAKLLGESRFIFLVAGDGPDKDKIQQAIIKNNLQDRVKLLGFVENMVDFYRSVDILVVTTQKDSFGLVQIESQACGVPVIAFDNQATREIQGDNSLIIVPNKDTVAMAESVRRLVKDVDLTRGMVERGFANSQLYSLQAYLQRLEDYYQSLPMRKPSQ